MATESKPFNELEHARAREQEALAHRADMRAYYQFMDQVMERMAADQAAERVWRDQHRAAKPAPEMSSTEIVSEARELHQQFARLSERYEKASTPAKAEIRQEMAPLVERERELRAKFTGRQGPTISRDQVPQQEISYGR